MTESMNMVKRNRIQGFTLLELMVAMALGLLVMGALASLFKIGMNSTILVEQRAEAQQEMRAGMDLMVKDLSLAGAGLPTGGLQLPTGTGNNGLSKFGCDQTGTCHIVNHTYPANGTSTNYMYGIIPGFSNGVEAGASIKAAPSPPAVNDSVTVVYADYNFPLSQYNAQFPNVNGTSINLTASGTPYPPLINSAGGIQQGDIIMVTGGGITAIGEVTNLSASGTGGSANAAGVLDFANGDPLNLNQTGAQLGNLAQVAAATGVNTNVTSVTRLYVVTYYLTTSTAAYAGAPQSVRLMRQVNGLTPVPVADDIISLQFAFDTYNSTNGALDANQANPIGAGESPNNIQKINLVMMGQSITNWGNKSQNLYLATDISARNMSFRNSYD
jgi:prepilin-type N-terminal cleavage/methylation domain-containing protein